MQKWAYKGRDWTIRELSDESGLHASTLRTRLVRAKWPVGQALTSPAIPPSISGRTGKRRSVWRLM